jgi:hypothetical protein
VLDLVREPAAAAAAADKRGAPQLDLCAGVGGGARADADDLVAQPRGAGGIEAGGADPEERDGKVFVPLRREGAGVAEERARDAPLK